MKRFGLLISVFMLVVALSIYVVVRLSLPLTEGEISLQKLTNTVVVERDSLGVPTVRGSDRLDVARATGFLHAQDRFFQMDLMRRAAAGELSELLGASNVEFDKRRRIHRMRSVAQKALARSSASERAMMQAYAEGVNAGVQALTVRPFEYLILRTQPERWLPEDTILVAHSMFFRLNDSDASHDASYGRLHEALPEELYRFVTAPGSDWDAPLVGNAMKTPPIPGPAVCDLRSGIVVPDTKALFLPSSFFTEAPAAGSNSWAVAGKRSATGKAIVANDMHLGLDVPNVWYRMRLIVETPAPEEDQVNVTGVTLPGIPVVIAGSNGSLAWGFTNSFGDWSDLVLLEIDPKNASAYRTPNGFRPFDVYTEIIQIAGGEPIRLTVRSTIWGPVIGEDYRGRLRALRWLAHEPEALNLRLAKFERAVSVNEAVSLAPTIGVPPQNLMLADTDGNIGWTIIGRIPRRVGYDPKLPAYWSESETGWKGWVAPHDYPAVINPDSGYAWTANARVVEGELLALIGDGGYLLGARASQIRDALARLEAATLDNMLAIQLDDRSRLHERWRDFLLAVLSSDRTLSSRRRQLQDIITTWDGRATIDSAGYRMVREFRRQTHDELLSHILQDCGNAEEPIVLNRMNQTEGPLWRLVSEQPSHLLPNIYRNWDHFLLTMADAATASCSHASLAACTWGEINTVLITHPLAKPLPFLSPWLYIHNGPLPGGDYTPRYQRQANGASERFAVSPGKEAEGYFHMPGGQSGHPLSSFYRAGHSAWVRGEPLPFLPGETKHILTLNP